MADNPSKDRKIAAKQVHADVIHGKLRVRVNACFPPLDGYEASMMSENANITETWRSEMFGQTYFVIFKRESRCSITECSRSGIRRAFISMGTVMGNENVLKHLSKIKQKHETIESFVENNAGCLIYE